MQRILLGLLILLPGNLSLQYGLESLIQGMNQDQTTQNPPASMSYGPRSFGTKTPSFREPSVSSDAFITGRYSTPTSTDRFRLSDASPDYISASGYSTNSGLYPRRDVDRVNNVDTPSPPRTLFVSSNGDYGYGGVGSGGNNGARSVDMSRDGLYPLETQIAGRRSTYDNDRREVGLDRKSWGPEDSRSPFSSNMDDISGLTSRLEEIRRTLSTKREENGYITKKPQGSITFDQWSFKPSNENPSGPWTVQAPRTSVTDEPRQRITPGPWQAIPRREASGQVAGWTLEPPWQSSTNSWDRHPSELGGSQSRFQSPSLQTDTVVDGRSSFPRNDGRMSGQLDGNRDPPRYNPSQGSNSLFGRRDSFGQRERSGEPRNDFGMSSMFDGDREPYRPSSQPSRQFSSLNLHRGEPEGSNTNPLSGLFGGGESDGLFSSIGSSRSPQSQSNAYPPTLQQPDTAAGSQDIVNGLIGNRHQEQPRQRPGQEPGQDERMVLSRGSSKYDDVFDENPNNWVRHNEPVEPLPQGVVVPLTFTAGDFYGVVNVGTPEQKLTVLFDSGSADMWVLPIEACGRAGLCTTDNKPFYKERSSTFRTKNPPQELDDTYVSGTTITGTVAFDTVKIGVGSNQIVVKNQAIGMPNQFQSLFENHDAIIGVMMVSPQIIHYKPDPILYQMTKQYGTAPVFGFYISKNNPQNSKLLFGGGDQEYYTGGFNFHPLVKVPFQSRGMFYNGWNIKLDGFSILGKHPYQLGMQNAAACIDSGTTTIVGPKDTINQINAALFKTATFQVTEDYRFRCDAQIMVQSYGVLPDIQIVMNGQSYVLWASDYIASTSDGWCYSVFQGYDSADMVIIGRSFMMRYYTRFDQSRKGVEFALARHPSHGNDAIIEAVRSGQKIRVKGA